MKDVSSYIRKTLIRCYICIRIFLQMKLRITLLLFSLMMITSCAKVDDEAQKNTGTLTLPIASFYVSGNEGPAPVTVTFHNTSEYCDQYLWTFRHNGSTSTQFEPTFTYYNDSGEDKTFLVTLTVTDSGTGETNTRSKSVLVHPSN